MKQGKRKGSKRIKKEDMLASVVEFFNQDRKRAFNYKQVAHGVGATTTPQKQMVFQLLEGMAEQNFLIEVSPGKYKANSRGTEVIGRFERRVNGKNHVITDDDESIFIAERNAMHAMDGDRVRVLVYAKRRGHDAEGEVVEIVEKTPQIFVGTLEVQKHFAFLLTDNKVLANDIFIPKTALKGGKTGDKAVVRITEWPDRARNPYGEVVDILGPAGENNTEIHAILAEFGLPYRYPEAVEKAANKIPDAITDEEIAAREDFRQVTTFTIDPKDAKDFDDALSIRRLSNGNWEVGVHIADVSYYVKPGSIIDKEAESRGTSVYLVDRVVPMLPERLCNEICSLRPDEDKLTFSCVFELNGNAEVQKSHIARTVIRSNRRFAYEEAQEVIETGEGDYKEEILALNDLAQKLRKRRFDNGSINFDRHEVKFDIDESGKPIGVYFKVSKEANKLIEEFMRNFLADERIQCRIGRKTVRLFFSLIYHIPGFFVNQFHCKCIRNALFSGIDTDLQIRQYTSLHRQILAHRRVFIHLNDIVRFQILTTVIQQNNFPLEHAKRTDRCRDHKCKHTDQKCRTDLPYQPFCDLGSFPDMVFRMPEDHIDQKHHPHRRAEHFFIMEHIQIPHSHRKLLSRKDVFQDSVIHYLLIYQVLAAEDIQCNDQHICHHHQQIAVFIHENI